jgi:hypothetical protein
MRVRAIVVCVSGVAATAYMAPLIENNLFLLGKNALKFKWCGEAKQTGII